MKNQIFITGGTGFLGNRLSEYWRTKGYKVTSISRSEGVNRIKYPESAEKFSEVINGCKALVNLAGASIVGERWTEEYKKLIYSSRIETTKFCSNAINCCETTPEVFISGSAIGIYGDRGDEILTEDSEPSSGFIANLCKDWEQAAEISKSDCALFIPRIGVVLERGFGALDKMELPFKLFVGGPIGSGRQYFSWVDIEDLVKSFDYALEHKLRGRHNITSPKPLKMREFAKTMGKVLNRPSLFKVPEFVLKLILGESSQEVLRSQKIIPRRLLEDGFEFEYADLYKSLKKIFRK